MLPDQNSSTKVNATWTKTGAKAAAKLIGFGSRTRPRGPQGESDGENLHCSGVIRAFPGDLHVMDVALLEPGGGDADETRLLAKLGKVGGPDIAHRGAETPGELVEDAGDGSLVWD